MVDVIGRDAAADAQGGKRPALVQRLIRFLGVNPNGGSVGCGISCLPFWVDGAPLTESIKEKIKAYRDLSRSAGLPLVVMSIWRYVSLKYRHHCERCLLTRRTCRSLVLIRRNALSC